MQGERGAEAVALVLEVRAERRQGVVVRVERRVQRLPGDAAEADVGGVREAAADPPLEIGRFARADEGDDDRLLCPRL